MQEQTPHTAVRTQRLRRISVFDGQDLKKAMLAGAAWLEEHRDAINALNVFPVPDGDTGSNMAATMQAATRDIVNSDEISAGVMAAKIAHGALLGARGNSGVILSQILRGIAQALDKKQTFTATDLANALQEAQRMAYRAVIKPVEGTILTVVRETAEAAKKSAERDDDLVTLVQEMVMAARQSVARTPDLLPILKQAGVVDSGGQGLCTILEGVWRYVRGESIVAPGTVPAPSSSSKSPVLLEQPEPVVKKGRVQIEEEFGYEVVFLLRATNQKLDMEAIRQAIIDMGGVSTVVAGDEQMLKVHTHTEWPGKILDYGVSLGSLLDINIENLQEQSLTYAAESAAEHASDAVPESPVTGQIAVVAVVSGAGFEKVFSGLGASAVVPGGQTMNPSTEELLAAVEAVSTDNVILLPNNSNVILSAQQVPHLTTKQVAIIPTDTMPQGIAALLAFNFEADFEANCQAMTGAAKNVQTAEITTAVRSAQIGGVRVREGDYIGLVNGNLTFAGQDIARVIRETLERMNIDNYEIVTLYYGEDVTREQAEETARHIKEQHSHLEIEVVDGGQPYYAYILSAE
ncbi:MAG TPA: DAK2 domain-containing protein [Ktedonobacteraceae bacterium]|nr:DAK2 domain-containing protein [Ktedonobacteraceae bacterium]